VLLRKKMKMTGQATWCTAQLRPLSFCFCSCFPLPFLQKYALAPDFSTSQGPIRTLKSRRNLTAMANKQNLILDVFTIIDDSICGRPNRN
jgi:hypothetical protein